MRKILFRCGNANVVACFQTEIARGDINDVISQYGADEEAVVKDISQVKKLFAAEGRFFGYGDFRKLYAAVAERVDLGNGGEAEHTVNGFGDRKVGIDGEGDIHFLLHEVHELGVFGRSYARDGVLGSELSCCGASENVDLVACGQRDQQIGFFRARRTKHGNVRAVARKADHVACVGYFI